MADVKQEEISLPETETAKKIVGETMDNEQKKDDDGFDQEISKQVADCIVSFIRWSVCTVVMRTVVDESLL